MPLKKHIIFLVFVGFLVLLGGGGRTFYLYRQVLLDLPAINILRDVRLQVPLRVFSRDGRLIAEYGEMRRTPLDYIRRSPSGCVRPSWQPRTTALSITRAWTTRGLLRAAGLLGFTEERRQGGSTITMRVASNFFLIREKTYSRKLKEILLALRSEHALSKQEILELYLNKIYLGNRAYGVGAAAQIYYGRKLADLSLAQTAMLAGLPKAPPLSIRSPILGAHWRGATMCSGACSNWG